MKLTHGIFYILLQMFSYTLTVNPDLPRVLRKWNVHVKSGFAVNRGFTYLQYA